MWDAKATQWNGSRFQVDFNQAKSALSGLNPKSGMSFLDQLKPLGSSASGGQSLSLRVAGSTTGG
ncbi:MAG: hypothetical protein ACRD3W_01950, partial [Terriglobales bacterium]